MEYFGQGVEKVLCVCVFVCDSDKMCHVWLCDVLCDVMSDIMVCDV